LLFTKILTLFGFHFLTLTTLNRFRNSSGTMIDALTSRVFLI